MVVTRTNGSDKDDRRRRERRGRREWRRVCVYVYLCVDTRVRVCVYVYLCARHTCCADGEQVWQHGSAAHMAVTCTTGGDKDERQ